MKDSKKFGKLFCDSCNMQITLNLLLDRNGKETEDFARKRVDRTYAKGITEDKLRIVCKCPFRHKALNESGVAEGP